MTVGLADRLAFLLSLIALVPAAVLVRDMLRRGGPAQAVPPREVSGFARIASVGHVMGLASAPVRVVEFSDFQCPFCAREYRVLATIRREYPSKVALVYRHFPLERIHPLARAAAIAAECAGEQGRFQEFHDRLFIDQRAMGPNAWITFAAKAGVPDSLSFKECMASDRPLQRIHADQAAGRTIGVNATPTVIVNGRMLSGTPSLGLMRREVERALATRAP